MKTHSNFAARILGILAIAATVGWLQPTAAYGQATAEGTDIVNTATVSFSDANSNTYSTVDGVATVKVGHAAGIDVVAAAATATAVSPSTLNTMSFNVSNIGNGVDTLSVSENNSDGTVLTVTKFTYNSTDYANIGLLNAALADSTVVAGGTVTIVVEYSIANDKGGEPSTYTLTGTSVRDGSATDNDNTIVTPALTGTVAVTPDGAQTLTHLPSNGTNYTFTFTVNNSQTGSDDFDLLATSPGSAVITIVSVNAFAGDSTRVTIAAGASPTFDVIYSVAGTATAQDTLYLEARSVAAPATTDSGFADMTVIEADLSITKVAYRSDRVTPIGAGLVLPGEVIEYLVTVTNDGGATASTVVVTDNLPAALTYASSLDVVGTWTVGGSGNNRTFTLTTTLAASASGSFWIQASVNEPLTMEFRTHLRRCLRQASLDLRVRGVASWVRWTAVVVVLLGGAAELRGGGTPMGTLITSSASVSYSHPSGTTGNKTSADVMVMMGQVAGVDVEQLRSSLAQAGTSILFSHTITNVGNGPDTFILTATSPDGWPIRMVLDVNGDGTEDAGDTPIVGPLALNMDVSAQVLVVLDIPVSTPAAAARAAATLTATSQFDTGVTDSITNDLEVTPPTPSLGLLKTVDAASAVAGDILTYTITYQAAWFGSNDLTIRDTIPAGLSYEAGTLRLGTRVLTDVSGDDEGYHDQTTDVIVVTVPAADIQPEDSVSFQVRVVPVRTATMIQNVAVASAGATVGASNVSETVIVGPDLLLEKTVQGPNPARSGDELVYSILLTNDGSAGLAQAAVVTDTLPAGLEIVDAGPAGTVDGNVVTWDFGDVNPGDQVEALLQVQVAGLIPDTLTVVNVAKLSLGRV